MNPFGRELSGKINKELFFNPGESFFYNKIHNLTAVTQTISIENPTNDPCDLKIQGLAINTDIITGNVCLVYGITSKGNRQFLYNISNVILTATTQQAGAGLGQEIVLPVPGHYNEIKITIDLSAESNVLFTLTKSNRIFSNKTSILPININLQINASSSGSIFPFGNIAVSDHVRFFNLFLRNTGAYNKDVRIRYSYVGSSYFTVDSKLASTDLFTNFEFVTIPVARYDSGTPVRTAQIWVTNNDGSNAIVFVEAYVQYIF